MNHLPRCNAVTREHRSKKNRLRLPLREVASEHGEVRETCPHELACAAPDKGFRVPVELSLGCDEYTIVRVTIDEANVTHCPCIGPRFEQPAIGIVLPFCQVNGVRIVCVEIPTQAIHLGSAALSNIQSCDALHVAAHWLIWPIFPAGTYQSIPPGRCKVVSATPQSHTIVCTALSATPPLAEYGCAVCSHCFRPSASSRWMRFEPGD